MLRRARARHPVSGCGAGDLAWVGRLAGNGRGPSPRSPNPDNRGRGRPRRPISCRRGCAMRNSPTAVLSSGSAHATASDLFGAGHVGRALALALAPLSFAVTWIDPRAGAFPSVPANVTCRAGNEPVRLLEQAPDAPSSPHDPQPCPRSRRRGGGAEGAALSLCRPDRDANQARPLRETLRQLGLPPRDIGRLICPIGLTEIHDKSPAAIAASITAQLLIRREAVCATIATVPARLPRQELRTLDPDPAPDSPACAHAAARGGRHHQALRRLRRQRRSTSISGRPRSMRCSARTAPASRRWSR